MRKGKEVAKAWLLIAVVILWRPQPVFAELTAHDYSVEATAAISEDPPQITLQWPADPNAQAFKISRKILGDQSWTELATIGGQETSWTDGSVNAGVAYEYQIKKTTGPGYIGWGYVCAAIRRAVVEDRGKMILVVENDIGAALPAELARLQQDLVGDGWTVVRRDVSKTMPVTDVKNVIRSVRDTDPTGTKAIFLFGHVPVPYSGNISPDMHPDDEGPWPADVYYAEFDGQWTDSTVYETNYFNPNVPGDGKFDQSYPPGPVRVQLGRVDLSNLTCFANKTPSRSELDLARQYLLKDHNFRHGAVDVQRRGMIFDRFYRGMEAEPQTCAAWRSFPEFFGHDQVRPIGANEYFPILSTDSYMWSYVVSGGSVYGCDYIGTSDDWALQEPKVVFASFLGSWFGQWDKESDFLRAPLGDSGYTLATIFSGQPQWILHPMAMGEPIGYTAMLTQNNSTNGIYPPQGNAGFGQIHIDLLGDPGLRMHVVKPPSALTGAASDSGVALTWNASPDPAVIGYYIYRASAAEGPYARISGPDAVTSASFNDPTGNANSFYMVRALKLEQTPTGSYFNLSQGIFYPDSISSSGIPETPRNLSIAGISKGSVDVSWVSNPMNVRAFEIQRRALPDGAFAKIAETPGSATAFYDTTLSAGIYAYRVKALGFAGDSDFSGEASVNFNPAWASIANVDKTTGGDWLGKYGAQGYIMPLIATNIPSSTSLSIGNANSFVAYWSTTDPECLWYPDGHTRVQSSWVNMHRAPMTFSFRFSDTLTHRISFYMLDFKNGARTGFVTAIDPYTGTEFASVYLTNFQAGEYVTIDARNYVDVQVAAEYMDQMNIIFSGIFFDATLTNTSTATIELTGTDSSTQGDWKNKYGADGQMIAGWNSNLPQGITVNQSNTTWTWTTSSSDARALNEYADGGRVAAAWYSDTQSSFDVNLNSTNPRQVALYFLDWDNSGRVEDVTITDSAGSVLLTQRIQNFAGGQYLVFNAEGSFRISANRVSGPNAILSGMFFGSASAVANTPVSLSPVINLSSGDYTIHITGQAGESFDLESTLDFRSWTKVAHQSLSGTTIDFAIPLDTTGPPKFFRAVLAP